jgi:hypothetical protein
MNGPVSHLLSQLSFGPDAGDTAEACPDQEQRTADTAEQREVESAERERPTRVPGYSGKDDGRRLRLSALRAHLIPLERRRAQRTVDLGTRVLPIEPAVVGQVGEDLL